MRWSMFALFVLVGVAEGQLYHEPVYIYGGRAPRANSTLVYGIQLLDMTGYYAQSLPVYATGQDCMAGLTMDVDNRGIVFAVGGLFSTSSLGPGAKNGLFRFDPTTRRLHTIWRATITSVSSNHVLRVHVDHNGDYICPVSFYRQGGPAIDTRVLKIDAGGQVTTILTSAMLPPTMDCNLSSRLSVDIDSGLILVPDKRRDLSPTTIRRPIWAVDVETRAVTLWHGAAYGWHAVYSLPQNHRTGAIEGPWMHDVFRVERNGPACAKVATLWGPTGGVQGPILFDLQTAPRLRQLAVSRAYAPTGTWLLNVDPSTWRAKHAYISYLENHECIEFYRGRHLQTIRVAPHKWEIRMSCPNHGGLPYLLAGGVSGVRPGIRLPDGSKINLNLDAITTATLHGSIPRLWNPGPGKLDSKGEARGWIDVSSLAPPPHGFEIPFWIAMVVLDPQYSTGIAYLPDTYVMRL